MLTWIRLTLLAVVLSGGTLWAAAPAIAPESARASAVPAPAGGAAEVDTLKDSTPALGIFALLMLLCVLVFIVVGAVLLVFAGIALLILLLLGIVSVSVFYGVLKRSVTAAARAMIIQGCALCGVPAGIVIFYGVLAIAASRLHPALIVAIGAVLGGASGAGVGYGFTRALALLYAAVTRRQKAVESPAENLPAK